MGSTWHMFFCSRTLYEYVCQKLHPYEYFSILTSFWTALTYNDFGVKIIRPMLFKDITLVIVQKLFPVGIFKCWPNWPFCIFFWPQITFTNPWDKNCLCYSWDSHEYACKKSNVALGCNKSAILPGSPCSFTWTLCI